MVVKKTLTFFKNITESFFNSRTTPRWIIFFIDVSRCVLSLVFAYVLRFNFSVPKVEIVTFIYVFPFVIVLRILSFLYFETYSGIIRYTSTRDAFRILKMLGAGSVFMAVANVVSYLFTEKYVVPFSIIIIDFLIGNFLMIVGRLAVKVAYAEISNPSREKDFVIIYGAGEAGIITKRTLDRDAGTKYRVLAFIDDDPKLIGKQIEGIEIFNTRDQLDHLLNMNEVRQMIIAIQNINHANRAEVIEKSLQHNINVLNVPPVKSWINGALSFKQIKKIKIEDLLERDTIKLDLNRIQHMLDGQTILITGAAGSIGSEIVRQLLNFNPGTLVLVDIAESPLYELELELDQLSVHTKFAIVIADIRDKERMRNIFNQFHPDIIYHAAAYKHVPMMELNPREAIRTNVFGSKLMADLASEFKVKKFVMVSTDKAVNPSSIMGASKRIAEIYAQALNKISDTKFLTTRFGNVLGSNGSVIHIFKKQIEEGKVITVTHPDITRYFMTIPEACQLVIEAGAIGNGGEIFMFDMGVPVRIVDLAKKMIQLSGLELDKDITIKYSGLRPGEKLFEELLNNKENTLPTHHEKILIATVREYNFQQIAEEIDELSAIINTTNYFELVKKMKQIVPEFISNNSEFVSLDS